MNNKTSISPKFDLNEPIFKMFVNVSGLTRQAATESIYNFMNSTESLQIIYLPSDITDFVCVWRGYKYEKMLNDRIDAFLEDLNSIISQKDFFKNDETIYKIETLSRNLKLLILNDI